MTDNEQLTKQKILESESIERCPHDEKNPYTMVLNSLIRDKSISPNCRMLIIFLLSNIDTWSIQIKQICREFKDYFGRDVVYKLVDEAMEAGYMQRLEYTENNFKRYKYRISERPKFKKCFLRPDFQDTGRQDTEDPDRKEGIVLNSSSIDIKKQQQQKKRAKQEKEPPKGSPVVVVSCESEKKEEAQEKQVYPCLQDVDSARFEKEWLTEKYSEEVVQNAIEFAQENHHTFTLPFIGVIKYAAKNGLKCETQAPTNSRTTNAELATKIDGKMNKEKTMRIDVCHDRVEFVCLTASILPSIITFCDKNFKQLMHHNLVKYGFKT